MLKYVHFKQFVLGFHHEQMLYFVECVLSLKCFGGGKSVGQCRFGACSVREAGAGLLGEESEVGTICTSLQVQGILVQAKWKVFKLRSFPQVSVYLGCGGWGR